MNIKKHKGRLLLNNLGMSPIIIVVAVLFVIVLGGVGFGVYAYMTNPFLRVYDSSNKLMNVKEVKSLEIGGELTGKFNLGKLLKNLPESESLYATPESQKMLADLDKDSTVKYYMNYKIDTENDKLIAQAKTSVSNLNLSDQYKDMFDSEGTLMDAESYISGFSGSKIKKAVFKFNKLPAYIPLPAELGVGGNKLSLSPMLDTWVDVTDLMNSIGDMNKNPMNNSKSSNNSKNSSSKETPKTIITCEKKELSFFDRVSLARIGTSNKLFSRAENKGQVDLDGSKATKLEFEIDMKNKSTIVEALDEMSKIACKDTSGLQNDDFVNFLAKDSAISKFVAVYYIDNKTGYPTKTSLNIVFDEEKIGSALEVGGELTLKNLNNTKVEEPSNIMPFEKYMEKIQEIYAPLLGRMSNPSMGTGSMSGQKCALNPTQQKEFLMGCMGGDTSQAKQAYCLCALQQLGTVSCTDSKAFELKVKSTCLR